MAKKPETFGYRPEQWDINAVQAAENATGRKRAELIRRCVRRSLGEVVEEILSSHKEAVRAFEAVLKEIPPTGSVETPTSDEGTAVNYKISRKQRKPAA